MFFFGFPHRDQRENTRAGFLSWLTNLIIPPAPLPVKRFLAQDSSAALHGKSNKISSVQRAFHLSGRTRLRPSIDADTPCPHMSAKHFVILLLLLGIVYTPEFVRAFVNVIKIA